RARGSRPDGRRLAARDSRRPARPRRPARSRPRRARRVERRDGDRRGRRGLGRRRLPGARARRRGSRVLPLPADRAAAPVTTVAALAALCFVLRAAAPLALRSRSLPPRLVRPLEVAAPVVLAALVGWQLFSRGVDARIAGVAAAGGVFLRWRSLLLSFAAAAATTATVRLV